MRQGLLLWFTLSMVCFVGCGADQEELESLWKAMVGKHNTMLQKIKTINDTPSLNRTLPELKKLGRELSSLIDRGTKTKARVSVIKTIGDTYEKELADRREKIEQSIRDLEEKNISGVKKLRTWFKNLPLVESGGK